MNWPKERARVAGLSRTCPPGSLKLEEARRDFRAARLEEAIRKAVAQAPPLTEAQRRELAVLLAPVPIEMSAAPAPAPSSAALSTANRRADNRGKAA